MSTGQAGRKLAHHLPYVHARPSYVHLLLFSSPRLPRGQFCSSERLRLVKPRAAARTT